MQTKIATTLILLSTLWLSPVSAETFYSLSQSAQLYEIDTSQLGSPNLRGTIFFGSDVVELVALSQEALYAFGRATDTLIVVDPADASVLSSVPLDRPIGPARGFDLAPNGVLYGLFSRGGVLGEVDLATIDPSTGVTNVVASLPSGIQLEALAIASNGSFFGVGAPTPSCCPSFLYAIDTSTGLLTVIG